jgi:hypothetical protein
MRDIGIASGREPDVRRDESARSVTLTFRGISDARSSVTGTPASERCRFSGGRPRRRRTAPVRAARADRPHRRRLRHGRLGDAIGEHRAVLPRSRPSAHGGSVGGAVGTRTRGRAHAQDALSALRISAGCAGGVHHQRHRHVHTVFTEIGENASIQRQLIAPLTLATDSSAVQHHFMLQTKICFDGLRVQRRPLVLTVRGAEPCE